MCGRWCPETWPNVEAATEGLKVQAHSGEYSESKADLDTLTRLYLKQEKWEDELEHGSFANHLPYLFQVYNLNPLY